MYSSIKTQKETNHQNQPSYLALLNTSFNSPAKNNLNQSTTVLMRKGSNQSLQKLKIQQRDRGKVIAKLDFSITQRKYLNRHQRCKTQRSHQYHSLRKNKQSDPNTQRTINQQRKTTAFQISKRSIQTAFKETQTRKSSQKHQQIQAYAISSSKGFGNAINFHQIGMYLGKIKHLMLIEGFNGTFASSFVKSQLPLQLIRRCKINEAKKTMQQLGKTISLVCRTIQNRLIQQQQKVNDNSGCSVVNILIDNDLITVANCGISQVYAFTHMGNVIKMNSIHDTQNKYEIQRVVGTGARLYRTVLNTPYKKDMQLCSPVRIYPSGLTFTRSLGYPASAQNELNKPIIAIPQLKYLTLNDVKFLVIGSSSIYQSLKEEQIIKIVEQQINKLSLHYSVHDIAQNSSKKIILQSISQGAKGSITVMVILVGVKQYKGSAQNITNNNSYLQKHSPRNNIDLKKKVKSLKYVGNRKSFFKQRQ